jgi:NADH dehydrogenase
MSEKNKKKNIVILGGGFGGIGVLKNLQKELGNKENIQITLISNNNFLLFTPMLPEIISGTIESRHIVTPIRSFCKSARFYEATVKTIDLEQRQITITHRMGKYVTESTTIHEHTLDFDYLVIALGSENNFFGNSNIEKYGFTLKTIGDAIVLRNHIIKVLEQAVIEQSDPGLRKALLTFVVVGGGFSGIEAVGAINDFVRESVKKYYPNLYMTDIRIVLVSATDKILEQIDEGLGRFALEKLKDAGVEFIMNSKVKDVTTDSALLDNNDSISCYSVVWTAGVQPSKIISDLKC